MSMIIKDFYSRTHRDETGLNNEDVCLLTYKTKAYVVRHIPVVYVMHTSFHVPPIVQTREIKSPRSEGVKEILFDGGIDEATAFYEGMLAEHKSKKKSFFNKFKGRNV